MQITIKKPHFEAEARNSIAKSPAGIRAVIKTAKNKSNFSLGYWNLPFVCSALCHFEKSPKPETDTVAKKKRKGNSGRERVVAETNDDEGTQEDDTSAGDVKPAPKGITIAHFIKFDNELLDIIDEDEFLKSSY
ncbi:hypothetical protein G6F37_007668 [Rhizopus arrhizus]|nr:hypothetical protein G6F38_005310 [Rhizopus arrhizus]KAG1156377.1 hypothetical protein G6F37_007668 [Rhizopus arrhizus]